jgi:predicted secreted protein
MSHSQKKYNDKDADYYMHQISIEILDKLNEQEREHLKSVIHTAIPQSSPKIIDLRFVVDLVFTRYFVVLLIGKDRRKQQRQHQVSGIAKVANVIAAIVLIIAMSLLISAVTLLILYLIKSALGIDLFKGHITNVLFKNQ